MADTDFECHSPFTFHIHGSAHALAWSPCLALVPVNSCCGIPELRRITYFGNSYKDNWKMLTSHLVNTSAFRCGQACGPTCLFTTKQSWSWSTVGSKNLMQITYHLPSKYIPRVSHQTIGNFFFHGYRSFDNPVIRGETFVPSPWNWAGLWLIYNQQKVVQWRLWEVRGSFCKGDTASASFTGILTFGAPRHNVKSSTSLRLPGCWNVQATWRGHL